MTHARSRERLEHVSASAQASEQEANDQTRSAQLRKEVLEAAIASALRRAPPALIAAARL